MFFDDLPGIGRTLIVGTLAYAGLVALVRLAGKRTLGKMNAFDLIVTVALGSTLATVLLSQDVALAEGVHAVVLETDGSLSVIGQAPVGGESALRNVAGFDDH